MSAALRRIVLLGLVDACVPPGSNDASLTDTSAETDAGGGGGGDTDVTHPDPYATCPVDHFEATPGLESCFACMLTQCCDAVQACDADEDCVYCEDNPLDTSDRCIDPHTFDVTPLRAAVAACQTERCVPPCGLDGGSSCVPGDCAASCYNYAWGCE